MRLVVNIEFLWCIILLRMFFYYYLYHSSICKPYKTLNLLWLKPLLLSSLFALMRYITPLYKESMIIFLRNSGTDITAVFRNMTNIITASGVKELFLGGKANPTFAFVFYSLLTSFIELHSSWHTWCGSAPRTESDRQKHMSFRPEEVNKSWDSASVTLGRIVPLVLL